MTRRRVFRTRRADERGLVVPLVAMMLVVLLGMTAFAVDLGLAYNQRRQNQAAADVAALSGVYVAAVLSKSPNDIFADVTKVSYESLEGVGTLTQWRTAFRNCSDPDHLANVLATSVGPIECISYEGRRLRVKLPDTEVPSIMREGAGFVPISTTAAAEAVSEPGLTNILPFAMSVGSASDATIICLKNPPGGLGSAECPGPSTGQFNDLDVPRPYEDDSNQNCDGGHQTIIRQNVAMGLDHELTVWTPSDIEIRDECINPGSAYPNPPGDAAPNTLNISTGNQPSNVEYGLLTSVPFSDGLGGRLTRSTFPRRTVGTWTNVDDTALWSFIGPFTESDTVDVATATLPLGSSVRSTKIPRSCWLVAQGIVAQVKANMTTCMDHYDLGQFTTDMFTADTRSPGDGTYDIQESPRFAWLPMASVDLATACASGSNCLYKIADFRPIFVQTLYWGKSSGGGVTVDRVFNPEEAFSGSLSGKQFAGVSAYTFNLEMLPDDVLDQGYYRQRPEIVLVR